MTFKEFISFWKYTASASRKVYRRKTLQFISSCILENNEVYFLPILLLFLSESSVVKIDVIYLSVFPCALITIKTHSWGYGYRYNL